MALTPMQYKSYVWPHNPRTYRITYQRQVAVQKVPFGRYALQNLGTGTARSWYRWGRRKRQALSRSLRHQALREMAARLPGRSIIP